MERTNADSIDKISPPCRALEGYELHGWRLSSDLSCDDNLMDLVMLVTRSSTCRQGSMACILAYPPPEQDLSTEKVHDSIITVAINRALFTPKDSDVHAEIAAIGKACQIGSKTDACSAYITMPPCKRCFAALVVAGVTRIVTRIPCPEPIQNCAKQNNIEVVVLGKVQEQIARINTFIYGHPDGKNRDNESHGGGTMKRQKTNTKTPTSSA